MGILRIVRGQIFKSLGKVTKRLNRLGPNFAHMHRSGNGHRLKNIGPMRRQGEHFDPGFFPLPWSPILRTILSHLSGDVLDPLTKIMLTQLPCFQELLSDD